jgi:hypothetical protein
MILNTDTLEFLARHVVLGFWWLCYGVTTDLSSLTLAGDQHGVGKFLVIPFASDLCGRVIG